MAERLDHLNAARNINCLGWRNDFGGAPCYPVWMAKPRHDWYLKEWLKTLGRKQADIARDLDMNKAKVSLTAAGKQAYDREDVNAIADYLNIRPFELLMHPDEAMTLRWLRSEMIRLAHETVPIESGDPIPERKKVSLN